MKKINIALIFLAILLVILGILIYKLNFINYDVYLEDQGSETPVQINSHDGTYIINGVNVQLKNGISEVSVAPGSASKTITRYFGDDIAVDLNGDGIDDNVFILTQDTGGSGIFYYVVARLNSISGVVGSQGLLLGDRIAPQTITLGKNKTIVVNYAVRKLNESFTVQPSIGKSIWLLLDLKTMQFGEVSKNFEGEADASRMTLNMKTWNWINTTYNNGSDIKPRLNNKFTLSFLDNNRFSAMTDCNSVGGEYEVSGNKITFSKMMSTLMYCENSQESDFSKMLEETQNYFFTSKGELVLELKYDSGSVFFK